MEQLLGAMRARSFSVFIAVNEKRHAVPWMRRLCEQPCQPLQMVLPERRNRVVIGMLIGGKIADRNVLVGGSLDTARTGDADRIGVEQQTNQQGRMIGKDPTSVAALVISAYATDVKFICDIANESRQMLFRPATPSATRQQIRLIQIARTKSSAHPDSDPACFFAASAHYMRPEPMYLLLSCRVLSCPSVARLVLPRKLF
jgi:hypothetical protein